VLNAPDLQALFSFTTETLDFHYENLNLTVESMGYILCKPDFVLLGKRKDPTAGLGPATSGLAFRCSATELRGEVGQGSAAKRKPIPGYWAA
jgi:hypothetical protein